MDTLFSKIDMDRFTHLLERRLEEHLLPCAYQHQGPLRLEGLGEAMESLFRKSKPTVLLPSLSYRLALMINAFVEKAFHKSERPYYLLPDFVPLRREIERDLSDCIR